MKKTLVASLVKLKQLGPLVGKRVMLRAWRQSDLAPFVEQSADVDVMRFFPNPLTEEETQTVVLQYNAHIQQYGYGMWVLEILGVAPCAGVVGLQHIDFDGLLPKAIEVAWRLGKAFWRQGYATEAARLALEVGFATYHLKEVVAVTAKINLPSQGLMKKLGMTYQAEDEFDHPRIPKDHPLCRHVLYRMTAQGWGERNF